MNKLAVISAFLGGVKNRYIKYQPDRDVEQKFMLASQIKGLNGLELCYPADFIDISKLKSLLVNYNFGVSAINFRSRREGKWLRGSFSSPIKKERQEVIDDFKHVMDIASDLGVNRISTCPLNDGHDYPFEMDYQSAYGHLHETLGLICDYNPKIRVCIEYKKSDARTRNMIASAGEALCLCYAVGSKNLGVTLDFGHALLAGERPAQAAVLLAQAKKLFYVHLNDNDRFGDWDLIPGVYNIMEFIEFFYFLKKVGYTDDWYAYDVMPKEFNSVETFNLVMKITRRLESYAQEISDEDISGMLENRKPVESLNHIYDLVFSKRGE